MSGGQPPLIFFEKGSSGDIYPDTGGNPSDLTCAIIDPVMIF